MAIQITDSRTAARLSDESRALARAASVAMLAPSMFTGRPWRWRVDGPVLSLHADRAADFRLLAVNSGIALHHARTALAANGVEAEVRYVPDPADPGLLATIGHAGPLRPEPADVRLYRAIAARRSDSRLFVPSPVPDATLERLVAAAHRPGVGLRVLDDAGHVLGVHIEDDDPRLLLGAGEATSAILLAANVEGLATQLGAGTGTAVATVRIGVPVSRPSP